jgi:hypothetical protein
MTRAMSAAKYRRIDFHTVPDYPAATVSARGRKRLNSTLEGVKGMGLAPDEDLEGFVIVISTCFANRHNSPSL